MLLFLFSIKHGRSSLLVIKKTFFLLFSFLLLFTFWISLPWQILIWIPIHIPRQIRSLLTFFTVNKTSLVYQKIASDYLHHTSHFLALNRVKKLLQSVEKGGNGRQLMMLFSSALGSTQARIRLWGMSKNQGPFGKWLQSTLLQVLRSQAVNIERPPTVSNVGTRSTTLSTSSVGRTKLQVERRAAVKIVEISMK